MPNFFRDFGKIEYDFSTGNHALFQKITNIFKQVKVRSAEYEDELSLYSYYDIKNGERPDVVSHQLYGSVDFYWTFFYLNDFLIQSPDNWPLSSESLRLYIENKYNYYSLFFNPNNQYLDGEFAYIDDGLVGKFGESELVDIHFPSLSNIYPLSIIDRDINYNLLDIRVTEDSIAQYSSPNLDYYLGIQKHPTLSKQGVTDNFMPVLISRTSGDTSRVYYPFEGKNAPRKVIRKSDSHIINFNTPSALSAFVSRINSNFTQPSEEYDFMTNEDYELEENDKKGKIRVIKPEFIITFQERFSSIIRDSEE